MKQRPQPQTPTEPQGRDLFQTPNYAVDLLIPFIPKHIIHIWECAAGEGKLGKRLMFHRYGVTFTDIRKAICSYFNFLTDTHSEAYVDYMKRGTAIITNPPFSLNKQFYKKCVEYDLPFALLINATYKQWIIDAVMEDGCEKIIPYRRIDYITPTGLSGATGQTADFHSLWLTRGFNIGGSETYVDLSLEQKETNI